jgi:hypothetical protein
MDTKTECFPVFARDGTRILAGVSANPSPNAIALAREAYRIAIAGAAELRPPTGRYNCHGLVFATRRAHIPPVGVDVDVDDVLQRDGYVRLRDDQAPQVGDVVAYRLDGEIEHTGFVSRVEALGHTKVVFVWSAWGGLGEFEHRVHVSPYKGTPEFWRLR